VFRPFTESTPGRISLVDGGLDDNRGVDPVWKTHRWLLVSDGGDVLRPRWGESLLWSLIRAAEVLWNESQLVQKRWLLGSFISGQMEGAYWGIDSSPAHYVDVPGSRMLHRNAPGYTPALARDAIACIRTDYDAFSSAEAAVLENHGYLLAEAATLAHLTALRRDAPVRIPHPAWISETKVRNALRTSGKKKFFGRW
jgi:NTE family protein